MGKKKRSKKDKKAVWLPPGMEQWAGGLEAMMGKRRGLAGLQPREQFLVGALIGAAATYVLSDEQLRGKLMGAGLRLYSSLAGTVAEMKEQMEDMRAEMAAAEESGPA